ncbi:hypothetical protein DSO57_1027976 [Entomophthora muscae]|uniref:Uncharacterized protein n=1 Tax=Entomophthora muscae TaxID=34485 RepID=A0ACC2RGH3_9FUNG|nr:hypothetical protein DSO57_1027976 [Entomophthora muscae]
MRSMFEVVVELQYKDTYKQPKGTKHPSKAPKAPRVKQSSSKKTALKTPPRKKPSPELSSNPSTEKYSVHSTGGEESEARMASHSFYNSASKK